MDKSKLRPYQIAAVELLEKRLKNEGVPTTGRFYDTENSSAHWIEKMLRFIDNYGVRRQPIVLEPVTTMNFCDLERNVSKHLFSKEKEMITNSPRDGKSYSFKLLYGGTWPPSSPGEVVLYVERYLLISPYTDGVPRIPYVEPAQDFVKAKTGKAKLEARLHKKEKPPISKLLASLVKK
jgi:hypothetical protein